MQITQLGPASRARRAVATCGTTALCVGLLACDSQPPPADCSYEAYWRYRATQGDLQQQWVDFWRPFSVGPVPALGASAWNDDYDRFPTTSDPLLRELAERLARKSRTKEELIRVVEVNRPVLDQVQSLPRPTGPLPLPGDSSFVGILTPQRSVASPMDLAPKEGVVEWLLIDAALANAPHHATKALAAVDNIIHGLRLGRSTYEVMRAVHLERLKWEFLLTAVYHRPAVYRPIVDASEPIVSRDDIAAEIREFARRQVVHTVQQPAPNFYMAKESIDDAGLLHLLNDYYKDVAKAVGNEGTDLPTLSAPSEEQQVLLDQVMKSDRPLRRLRHWRWLQDLIDTTKAFARGDSSELDTRVMRIEVVNRDPARVILKDADERVLQLWPPEGVLAKGLGEIIRSGNGR